MIYLLQFLCDTHTLIISYTLLGFHNLFLYMISQEKIMTECDSNHWLSQGASFGHLGSKPWMCKTSAIFCFKIKPFFITHPDTYMLETFCLLRISRSC